jgi:maleate isomerase
VTGTHERPRIGLIVPSTNLTIERLLHRSGVTELFGIDVTITRLKVTTIASDPVADDQFSRANLREAALLVADSAPDVIVWTGTSSFWLGVEDEIDWMRSLGAELGVPVTSATEAVIEALRQREIKVISLFTPYEEPVHLKVTLALEELGFHVAHHRNLGITDNAAFAAIETDRIEYEVSEIAFGNPVVVVCTGILALLREVEVFDSLVAFLWYSMALAGSARHKDYVRAEYGGVYETLASRQAAYSPGVG